MQTRKLLAAVFVLGLLILYVWKGGDPEGEAVELGEGETRLVEGAEASDVQSITIRSGTEGKSVTLQRSGEDSWLVSGSPARPADEALSEAAVEAAVELVSVRSLEAGDEPEAYGLGEAALGVELTLQEGRVVSFRLGDEPPVGDGRYCKVDGDPAVHLVHRWSLTALERDPLDFRDRRLLPIDSEAIASVSILPDDGEPGLVLQRRGRHWFLSEDSDHRAETALVRELLVEIVELQARRYASPGLDSVLAAGTEEESDPERPRLQGSFRIELSDADGRTASLALGAVEQGSSERTARAGGELLPAGVGDEDALVPTTFLEQTSLSSDPWRALELLDFNPWLVDGLTWSAGGQTWVLSKDDEGWTRAGADEPVRLDGDKVHDLLAELDSLRAAGYAAAELEASDAGTEVARMALRQSDGTEVALTLYRGPTEDYASVDGEPGLREVDAEVHALIGNLRPLTPSPGEEGPEDESALQLPEAQDAP